MTARKDALARLDAAVDAMVWCRIRPGIYRPSPRPWRAYKRALRALLRERAGAASVAAIDALHDSGMTPLADIGDAAYAAVLGRGSKPR